MKTMTKGLVGTVAAGAMALTSASPAFARDDRRDGIGAGEIIAGALIIGGIAAIASAASKNKGRDSYYDYNRRGYDDRYYNGTSRDAVERCVAAAESRAGRVSYGNADVTDIRNISRNSKGYTVKGRIAVNTRSQAYRASDRRYGNGWNNDYRGWNNRLAGYDSGNFTCKVQYGRVTSVKFSGIRGL